MPDLSRRGLYSVELLFVMFAILTLSGSGISVIGIEVWILLTHICMCNRQKYDFFVNKHSDKNVLLYMPVILVLSLFVLLFNVLT